MVFLLNLDVDVVLAITSAVAALAAVASAIIAYFAYRHAVRSAEAAEASAAEAVRLREAATRSAEAHEQQVKLIGFQQDEEKRQKELDARRRAEPELKRISESLIQKVKNGKKAKNLGMSLTASPTETERAFKKRVANPNNMGGGQTHNVITFVGSISKELDKLHRILQTISISDEDLRKYINEEERDVIVKFVVPVNRLIDREWKDRSWRDIPHLDELFVKKIESLYPRS